MADPISVLGITVATKLATAAAIKLIESLRELRSVQRVNSTVVKEIDEFISSVNSNIELLNKQLPNKNSSMALEKLQEDLDKAREELDEGLKNGSFKRFWTSQQIQKKLESLRRNIINQIQVATLIATLEVTINADKKMDNFESRMLELAAMSAAQNHAAASELREFLQPLVVGMRQDQRLQSFVSTVRQNEKEVDVSSETQKFLADVLSSLEGPIEEGAYLARPAPGEDERDDYLDLFTKDLMTDPVKCTDGQTYDRFSVLKYNLLNPRKPLVIAADDLNMRRAIFEKFADEGVETKFRNSRKSYREQALLLAKEGHSAEALSLLQNVLQWAPNDKECLTMTDRLKREVAEQRDIAARQVHSASSPKVGHQIPPQPEKVYRREPSQNGEKKERQLPIPERASQERFVISIVILFACLPCSLCCISCLFPGYCSGKYKS